MPNNGEDDRELREDELIYDWNSVEKVASLSPRRRVTFFDETLRDGIQSPSVVDPRIEDKILFTEIANDLGIQHIDIGLPGAGQRAVADCVTLASFIRDQRLAIRPACAGRTHVKDVQAGPLPAPLLAPLGSVERFAAPRLIVHPLDPIAPSAHRSQAGRTTTGVIVRPPVKRRLGARLLRPKCC